MASDRSQLDLPLPVVRDAGDDIPKRRTAPARLDPTAMSLSELLGGGRGNEGSGVFEQW
jgi:hypothetical protein